MTLTRQLFAGIALVFIALLVGIEAIYVSTARSHLEEQLDAHANETATSLALSLGSRASSLDASLVNITINPVFDRGYFESIEVRSPRGERIFGRRLERREVDVPAWFAALVALKGPTGQALVSSGWRQLGKVVVQIHPGYAYQQLYDTALATLAWLVALFALALVGVRYYLAGILKPLRDIERTAIAISNRNFAPIGVKPGTLELQRVTLAMNSLSAKIRDIIRQESDRAERLRKDAFEDSLIGQLNRRGFEHAVAASLDEGGEAYSGALGLFYLAGLDEINRLFGLSRGDDIMKVVADELAAPGDHGRATVGRWQGPTLAAFVTNVEQQVALEWADGICKGVTARLSGEGLPEAVMLSSGVAHFSEETITVARLAEMAEDALAKAVKNGGAALTTVHGAAQASRRDLRNEIESSIAANRITLLSQRVISIADQHTLQVELLASLTGSDGKAISAGVFVPIASRHGLLASLDGKVVERALRALERIDSLPRSVSVNVSMQSIGDSGFRTVLKQLLTMRKALASRFTFEVTGYAASHAPELVKAFSAELHALGARIALDTFDIDRNAMSIVHELLPAYVKLAPAFTQQITARDDLRFIVEAIVRMLQPLEIPLIAQGVEDLASVPVLAELGIAAYQGYAAGRPAPLTDS